MKAGKRQDADVPGADKGMGEKSDDRLVLVVDDFTDNREMYAQYLEYRGFRVAEAADGREALEKAFALAPDLIVMDLSLPGIDGWEATRRLKGDGRTKAIPVVVLTGHALEGHSQGAKDAGCDSFLIKPCEPQELEQEIRRVLSLGGGVTPVRGRKERHG